MSDPEQAVPLIGVGLAGGIAHILMTVSFRPAEAAGFVPFEYLSNPWAAVADVMVFADIPNRAFLVAAPLILAGSGVADPTRLRSWDRAGGRSRSTLSGRCLIEQFLFILIRSTRCRD